MSYRSPTALPVAAWRAEVRTLTNTPTMIVVGSIARTPLAEIRRCGDDGSATPGINGTSPSAMVENQLRCRINDVDIDDRRRAEGQAPARRDGVPVPPAGERRFGGRRESAMRWPREVRFRVTRMEDPCSILLSRVPAPYRERGVTDLSGA